MIEKHVLHGVVNRNIRRPSPDMIADYARHDAAKIGDSMARHGIMRPHIKPIAPGNKVVGPAVTVLTRPGDALYVAHAADIAQPGDVVVIDAGGAADLAVFGERIAAYMKNRHVAGIVIDGAVRDAKGIIEVGLPTFCSGVTPRLLGSQGPGAINVPISCGGTVVNPGDVIVGDDDGVVVVPADDLQRVIDLADAHLDGEMSRVEAVSNGQTISDVQNLGPKLAYWTRKD